MKSLSCLRCAFTGGVVIALLAGCGGAQGAAGLSPLGQRGGIASKQTFAYTGSEQKFKVPAGVTQVVVTVDGASGAPGYDHRYSKYGSPGGLGSRVRATIPVMPRETLAIFVGGSGSDGGFNGGGASSTYNDGNGYGGGASDVRQGGGQLADRVVVGAGGGGGGDSGAYISTSCGYSPGGTGGMGGKGRGGLGGDAHGA
ncbi:MAG: glycine-rich protein, partial [Candidatus Cybelea sp.]